MENFHSEGGIWLFNTMCSEVPGLKERVKDSIIEAAYTCYELERNFIESLFKADTIRTLDKSDLLNFIQNRINMKLTELGYDPIFTISKSALDRMSWFGMLSGAREFGDFFAVRVTEYTERIFTAQDLFGNERLD
jgi:ribonucleotide reductase beta subunit family protein with ferritin-like domain